MYRHWHQLRSRQQKPSPWIALGVIFFSLYFSNHLNSLLAVPAKADSVSNTNSDTESTQSLNSMEQSVYEQINKHRESKGLPPLVLDAWLTQHAREHSQAMASGKVPFDRELLQQRNEELINAGPYHGVVTIIGMNQGFIDPAQANTNSWLRHTGNTLATIEDKYELTGVGVAMNVKGEYYFTQILLLR